MKEFDCNELDIKIVIERNAYENLLRYSFVKENKETGGILIGYYDTSLKNAYITEVTREPEDSKSGPTWFIRGIKGLKKLIIKKWEKEEYYLGEWHYHPGQSPEPSKVDINQMRKNAKDKHFNCKEPILVIVGGTKDCNELSVTLILNNMVYRLKKL